MKLNFEDVEFLDQIRYPDIEFLQPSDNRVTGTVVMKLLEYWFVHNPGGFFLKHETLCDFTGCNFDSVLITLDKIYFDHGSPQAFNKAKQFRGIFDSKLHCNFFYGKLYCGFNNSNNNTICFLRNDRLVERVLSFAVGSCYGNVRKSVHQIRGKQQLAREGRGFEEAYAKKALDYSDNPGFVYLCYSAKISRYKIGLSVDPRRRAKELNTYVTGTVELVHTIKTQDMKALEALLHQTYESSWVGGEWFDLDANDVAEICAMY